MKLALVHDWLYAQAGFCVGQVGEAFLFSREESDQIFLLLMAEAGVGRVKRKLAWAGVRAFGWMFWGKNGATVCKSRPKYVVN